MSGIAKKILYIVTQSGSGGAQKYVLALAGHFGGSIAAGGSGDLFSSARQLGLKTFNLKYLKRPVNPFFDLLAFFELVKLVRAQQPDIVHINSSKAGILGSFLKPFTKARIVFTAHGFVYNEPHSRLVKKLYILLEKWASYFRDYIIAVSETDLLSAIKHNLIRKDKISIVYNGLGQVTFLPRTLARTELNLPENPVVIGCLSDFYQTKGLDVLITAASLLPATVLEQVKIILAGDGPERHNLQALAVRLKVPAFFPGRIKEGSRYLKGFDIFVLPSRKEGFAFALLEAMRAGLPIITTSAGGSREALGDAGILVPPEDPIALADSIKQLVSDSLLMQSLSEKAYQRSLMFTEEKMLEETEKIYRTV